ncbi:unnamed protein product, partial [Rotaria socialis]
MFKSSYSSQSSHHQSSRSERSASSLQGSTSPVDKPHRLHLYDSIYPLFHVD